MSFKMISIVEFFKASEVSTPAMHKTSELGLSKGILMQGFGLLGGFGFRE